MRTLLLFLAAVSAAFAQLDSNVVTITASRQLNVQPDQISLTVYVDADPSQTLDNILSALQGAKITAADLSNVSSLLPVSSLLQPFVASGLQWLFTPTVSFSDMPGVLAALAALSSNQSLGVTYYVNGATASPQAAASQPCPYPALINDARIQAGKLAAVAAVTLGPIVSLAQPSAPSLAPYPSAATYIFESLIGIPSSASLSLSTLTSGPDPACSLTVQFKLGQ